MARRIASVLAICLTVLAEPVAADLSIIVHKARTQHLTVENVSRIYLKDRRFWGGGERVVAVNRDAGSPQRQAFEQSVLGMPPQQLANFWNRQYYQGVLPPATLASDEAVLRFVAREPRAIGYVEASSVDDSVRVLLRIPTPVGVLAPTETRTLR